MVSDSLRMLFKREAAEPASPVEPKEPPVVVAEPAVPAAVAPAAAEEEITGAATTLATKIFGHKHHHKVTTELYPEDDVSSTTPPKGEIAKVTDQAVLMAHEMGIPTWGLVAIVILVLTIVLGILGFCIRRCCKKRRSKDGKKGMKGVDLKSVQLLGSAYKEKVRDPCPYVLLLLSVFIRRHAFERLRVDGVERFINKFHSFSHSLFSFHLHQRHCRHITIFIATSTTSTPSSSSRVPPLLQVQPDMEELTENAEEPDEGESKQSEQKLGKLQYKVSVCVYLCVKNGALFLENLIYTCSSSPCPPLPPLFSSSTTLTQTVWR